MPLSPPQTGRVTMFWLSICTPLVLLTFLLGMHLVESRIFPSADPADGENETS